MEDIAQIDKKTLQLDHFEATLSKFEPVECPLIHLFTKGLYTRQILMPAITINSKGEEVETVVISKIHKTQHPFNVSRGKCAVYNQVDDFLGIVEAPYLGVTMPGTRRILHILESCIWATSHPLDYITGEENEWDEERKNKLLLRIENDLIEKHEIKLEELEWHSQQLAQV